MVRHEAVVAAEKILGDRPERKVIDLSAGVGFLDALVGEARIAILPEGVRAEIFFTEIGKRLQKDEESGQTGIIQFYEYKIIRYL